MNDLKLAVLAAKLKWAIELAMHAHVGLQTTRREWLQEQVDAMARIDDLLLDLHEEVQKFEDFGV